jgi:AcrR family transcriptional regulator
MPLSRFEKLDPDRRQRLLQAAAQEFAAEGFEGASLGRIAEGAGVSKPALYYYFEDKADLFVTVVREAWEQLSRPVERVSIDGLDAATFWPTLESLLEKNLEQCREQPWLTAVGKLAYHPPREGTAAGAVAELFAGARDFVHRLLRRGQEIGLVRRDLPEELLLTMLTAADTAADHWMVDHWDELGPEEAERISHVIFHAMRSLLTPPGPEGVEA